MKILLIPLLLILSACSETASSAVPTAQPCAEAWVAGADVTLANPCFLASGHLTTLVTASLPCPNGDTLHASERGWWLESENFLYTDGSVRDWPSPAEVCGS